MTDTTLNAAAAQPPRRDIGLKRRYAAERRFRLYGILAIAVGVFSFARFCSRSFPRATPPSGRRRSIFR